MAEVEITGTGLGNSLYNLLTSNEDIQPGDQASYQLCKAIYVYHVLGGKIVDSPITAAQSMPRVISVSASPGDAVRDQFNKVWQDRKIDAIIANFGRVARIYGLAAIAIGAKNRDGTTIDPREPIAPEDLPDLDLWFNVLDPLNTAGSCVLPQDPNNEGFQKPFAITAQGVEYHQSRAIALMHESPIYIEYTNSAFGYVGRSVFQRALYPLKSFIQTMQTDDMVSRKAGVLIVKLKQVGSIINSLMAQMAGYKRNVIKEAQNNNVISISPEEAVETLNMQNVDAAALAARDNILKNIATSCDMPSKWLANEALVEGFGEGTEDAKVAAAFVDSIRAWLKPGYEFFDHIIQRLAWTEDFYKVMQEAYPDTYKSKPYKVAFMEWRNSFKAEWPSLLREPESEKAKTEDIKLKGVIAFLETLLPQLDPTNAAALIEWAIANVGENKIMFPHPLTLDLELLLQYIEEQKAKADEAQEQMQQGVNQEPAPPKPMANAA